jgi:ribosomal protein S18 acetylase RimI-like enzyme
MNLFAFQSLGYAIEEGLQTEVIIREAKESDLQLMREHAVETGWASLSETERGELDKEEWAKHIEELFEKLFNRETHRIFVAENESHVFLGYLWVGEGSNMMTGKRHGFIYDIFVEKEFRGKGVGRTLLEKAESFCREKGYSRILLMVSVNNEAAAKLYDKMGFKTEQVYMGKVLD